MSFIQFVRVRDLSTGHEFDVPEQAVDPEAYEVLPDYPPNETGVPRPAKHRVDKDGEPADVSEDPEVAPTETVPRRRTTKKATTKAAATTEKEK